MIIEDDLRSKFQAHFMRQYYIVQDKIQTKMPYYPYVKMAKIKETKDQSVYTYYYETLDCNEEIADFNFVISDLIPDRRQENNQQAKQENKTDPIQILKQLFFFIIEGYHQAANFGLYFDLDIKSYLLQRESYQVLVLKPKTIFLPDKFLKAQLKFRKNEDFHQKQSQLILTLIIKIRENIGAQDEDSEFFKQLQNNNRLLIDYLVTDEMIKKRYWKNSLKESLILYNITNPIGDLIQKKMDLEQKLVDAKRSKQRGNNQDNQEPNQLTQIQLWILFMKDLHTIKTDQLIDVMSDFAKKAEEKEILQKNSFREFCQPKFIKQPGLINIEVIDPKPEPQAQQKVGQQNFNPDISGAGLIQFKVHSKLSANNLLSNSLGGSAQSKIEPDSKVIKILTINFKTELLETKLCYLFKTQIPEIAFQIDTADEIMYVCNMIQKQYGQTNIFIDEQRKVSMYSSVVLGQPINILGATLKVIDIHTIYFYFLLDFHAKYITLGKTIKEHRYQQMVEELMHYVNDYENDFNAFDWLIDIIDFIKFDWLISKKWNFFQGFKFSLSGSIALIKLNLKNIQIQKMAGAGKSGKGVGKVGAKRHAKKTTKQSIEGITKPAIRRLARRGGVKRISSFIYDDTRNVLKSFLESVVRDAVTYTEHARRKTVTAMDVVYSLKRQGRTLYGFGA
ncbi:hypothetical protein pb186bvf_000243 [Paramecium bursaria]